MSDPRFAPPTVRPFSFNIGWELSGQAFAPVNFAEEKAQSCIKFALLAREQRNADAATELLDQADWWRRIAAQPNGGSESHEHRSFLMAEESVGLLLTRAKAGSSDAVGYLRKLMEMVVSNLCSLVIHETGDTSVHAAAALVKGLSKAVSDFESLAKVSPGSLLPETRTALGIPGFISPASEKVKDNIALVTQLEVGTESLFYLPTTTKGGKTMKLVTGPNLWAARLIGYILSIRAELDRMAHLQTAYEKGSELGNEAMNDFFFELQRSAVHAGDYSPEWLPSATALKPFSPESWQSWFDVAWAVVVDVTKGKPESEPVLEEIGKSGANKPVSYRLVALEGTQISNTRAVIRSRLRQAFRLLATRDLPRTPKEKLREKKL